MTALVGLLIVMLAYPLALLFIKSFAVTRPGEPTLWAVKGWVEAFTDGNLAVAIGNTFYLAFLRVVITTVLAIFFAWVVTRTDTPLKGFIEVTLWLGFFLPLLPMTMGWILLLDPYNGLVNKLLMQSFGLARPPFDIFSYWGIVWCHLAFSTSVRFLLLTPAFTAMDAALEDAARTSGSNNMGVLLRITIPILAPAVLASTALGFIRSLESLEIEMVLGIPAGHLRGAHQNLGLHSLGAAALRSGHCAVQRLSAFCLFSHLDAPDFPAQQRIHHHQRPQLHGADFSARPLALGDLRRIPSLYFRDDHLAAGDVDHGHVHGVFRQLHDRKSLDGPPLDRGIQPIPCSSVHCRIRWCLDWVPALSEPFSMHRSVIVIVRTRLPGRGVVDIALLAALGFAGVLISLALLWAAFGSGDYVKLLYGTIALLVLAIIIKEMPLGTQIIKASVLQISRELEEASSAAGATRLDGFRRIMLPLLKPTMMSVGIIVFISAARDIPTVIFLSTSHSRTLSLLMLDYIADANQEKAAVLGVFLVFLIFALLFVGWLLGFRRTSVRS